MIRPTAGTGASLVACLSLLALTGLAAASPTDVPLASTTAAIVPGIDQGTDAVTEAQVDPALPALPEASIASDAAIAPDVRLPTLPAVPDVGLDIGAGVDVSASSHGASAPTRPTGIEPAHVAAVTTGVAAVGAGSALAFAPVRRGALWILGRIGALTGSIGLMGLFSRIQPERVLEHETRARIMDTVAANPGLTMLQLQDRLGVAWGTVNHHVRKLADLGHLVSVRQGPRRLLYAADTAEAKARQELALLNVPTARRIALAVQERPGVRQTDLCASLSLNKPSASKHLARFEAAGLIEVRRDGGACHYEATPRLEAALLVATANGPPRMAPLAAPSGPTPLPTTPLAGRIATVASSPDTFAAAVPA